MTLIRDSYDFGDRRFYRAGRITTAASLGLGVRWPDLTGCGAGRRLAAGRQSPPPADQQAAPMLRDEPLGQRVRLRVAAELHSASTLSAAASGRKLPAGYLSCSGAGSRARAGRRPRTPPPAPSRGISSQSRWWPSWQVVDWRSREGRLGRSDALGGATGAGVPLGSNGERFAAVAPAPRAGRPPPPRRRARHAQRDPRPGRGSRGRHPLGRRRIGGRASSGRGAPGGAATMAVTPSARATRADVPGGGPF